MGKLDGKVAFITGAARGQGRSHALRLALEGANIIAVDLCEQLATIAYPMATPEDLAETARQVEALDRRIFTQKADVRDLAAMKRVFEAGVAALGPVDIVVANAGVAPQGAEAVDAARTFQDVIDTNLTGVFNTVHVAAPSMIARGKGGAIVLTSSTQGLSGRGGDGSPGQTAYTASKHAVVGLMRTYSYWLAPHNIRVNTVHPTGVNSPMVMNDVIGKWVEENPSNAAIVSNLMPVPLVECVDISNAVLYLVSDDGRYVTGITLPVDAGFGVK